MKKSTEDSRQFRKKDIEDEFSSVAEGVKITEQGPNQKRSGMKKIDTGGGAYIGGTVSTGGGDFVGRDQIVYDNNIGSDEITSAFEELNLRVQTVADLSYKTVAETAIKVLRQEAEKGAAADTAVVMQWIKTLELAPQVFLAAVELFSEPIKGLSPVFKEVAEKAAQS